MPISEKLKVIDLKLDKITEKMRQLEQIKTYLTAKRNRTIQEPESSITLDVKLNSEHQQVVSNIAPTNNLKTNILELSS